MKPTIKPSHKGMLHKALGVNPNAKIPDHMLRTATHSGNAHTRSMAQFALNMKKK